MALGSRMQIRAGRPHRIACQNLENFYARYQELRQKKQVKTNQKNGFTQRKFTVKQTKIPDGMGSFQ